MAAAKRLISHKCAARSKEEALAKFRDTLGEYGYDPEAVVVDSGPTDVGRGVFEIMYVRPEKKAQPKDGTPEINSDYKPAPSPAPITAPLAGPSEVEASKVLITGFNPRKHFDEDRIKELASSIEAIGLQEPIVVRPKGTRYELVLGERRLRAFRLLRRDRIPAVVREMTDDEVLDAMIAENVCREDLNPIEEANHLKRVLEVGRITQAELARRAGKSQEWVAQRLLLTSAPSALQDAIIRRRIKPSAAVDIIQQKDKEFYQETLDDVLGRIERDEVTQKEVREIIRSHSGRIPIKAKDGKVLLPDNLLPFAEELRLHPDAVAALRPIAEFPVYHEVVRKLKLMQGVGVELTPEKVAGAVKGAIGGDYEAARSLNLRAPPQELAERWRHFDAAGCLRCKEPGHVKLEGERPPDDEFCVDHACYRRKLGEALERLEAERAGERRAKPPEPPALSTAQPNDLDCDWCRAYRSGECAEGYLPGTCPQHQADGEVAKAIVAEEPGPNLDNPVANPDHAAAQEASAEEGWRGESMEDDEPDCFMEYPEDPKEAEKKCSVCPGGPEMVELCKEETPGARLRQGIKDARKRSHEQHESKTGEQLDPHERRVITRAQYALVRRAMFLTPDDDKEPKFEELEPAPRLWKDVKARYGQMPSSNTAKRELMEWCFPWLKGAGA